MRRQAAVVRLTDEEASQLREWTRRGKSEHRVVERARIILLANAGRTNEQIAAELKTRTARVSKWRQRFSRHRLEGLGDAPRSGFFSKRPGNHREACSGTAGPGASERVLAMERRAAVRSSAGRQQS